MDIEKCSSDLSVKSSLVILQESYLAGAKCRGGNVVQRVWIEEADRPGFQTPASSSTSVPLFICKMETIVSTSQGCCEGSMSLAM